MINCVSRKRNILGSWKSLYHKKKYAKNWMSMKIGNVIKKRGDCRYIHFKNVLSTMAADECIAALPGPRQFYKLEEYRKYDQDGSESFQKIFRKQSVHFRERGKNQENRETYFLADFFLAVAFMLGLKDANLSDRDKAILHEKLLQVFFYIYQQLILTNYIKSI